MPVAIGQTVEDFQFLRPDGTAVLLSDLMKNATVLIFLRHLG